MNYLTTITQKFFNLIQEREAKQQQEAEQVEKRERRITCGKLSKKSLI